MRIVGGKFKGRAILAPKSGSYDIRPTTDRARESLFNILKHGYAEKLMDSRVLDLFAGTGALGLEAMSCGASFALFVETGSQGRGLIRQSIQEFSLQRQTKLFRRDATKLGQIGTMKPFDLVFADPPYGKGLGEQALDALKSGEWLCEDALIVLEENVQSPFIMPKGFELINERISGTSIIRFIQQIQTIGNGY